MLDLISDLWSLYSATVIFYVPHPIMNKSLKQTLRKNIAKFIVGAILLGLSIQYLQTHPAEKSSIISSFEILYEKATVFVYKVIGRDRQWATAKHDMQRKFDELLSTATTTNCLSADELLELEETAKDLEREDSDGFADKAIDYNNKGYYYKELIEKECKK